MRFPLIKGLQQKMFGNPWHGGKFLKTLHRFLYSLYDYTKQMPV